MIYITGDTHGNFDRLTSLSLREGQNLTKNDYLIILGDFGLLWENIQSAYEADLIHALNLLPFTTLFIDGNHENFKRLEMLEEIELFGNKVGKISNSIYHLKRGNVYTIEDKTFFCFGGGISIDKHLRLEFISWWSQEMPNHKEMAKGIQSLRKNNWEVDYVLTHDAPADLYPDLNMPFTMKNNLSEYLNLIKVKANFKKWHFGHFHDNKLFDNKYQLLYDEIILLK